MSIGLRPFFSGISDMSFVSSQDDADSIAVVMDNTPTWGTRLKFDYSIAAGLDLPIVNIGPWGHDYHQKTERVHMPYSFEVVPELVWRVVGGLTDEVSL
jgi:arginine utilization protein RocB